MLSMHRSRVCSLMLVTVLSWTAEQASAESKVPSADELAPIVIPPYTAKPTNFALALSGTCESLLGSPTGRAPLPKAPFDAAKVTPQDASGFQATCQALRGDSEFSEQDFKNLREFKKHPDPVALGNRIIAVAKGTAAIPAGAPAALSSAGDVLGTVIEGLSKFIYDRAKAEAGLYLAKKLKKELCSGERAPFFPHICVAFESVDFTVSLSAVGTYLSAAARKDLQQVPDTALVYGIHAFKDAGASPQEEKHRQMARGTLFGARLGLSYYRAVASGRTPLDAARSLHAVKLRYNPAPPTFEAIQFGSQLVDAITLQEGWNGELGGRSPLLWRCYAIGVLFTMEELRAADGDRPAPFDVTTPKGQSQFAKALAALAPILVDIKEVNDRMAAVQSASKPPGRGENAGGFANPAGPANAPGGPTALTKRDYAVVATRMLERLALDGKLLAKELGLEAEATSLDMLAIGAEFGEVLASRASPGDTALAAIDLLNQINRELDNASFETSPVVTKIRHMLPFVAQLAHAKSADEVASVMQAAAVPIALYEVKAQRSFVAINAMAGVVGAAEAVDIGKASWSGVFGPFAPVGVHATTPTSFGHIGGFFSVLNLGALVAARFNDETGPATSDGTKTNVGTTAKVDLVNVLCPGLFATLGFGSSPFIVGAGVQIVPARQITKIAADNTKEDGSVPAIQTLGCASIDVPIFGL